MVEHMQPRSLPAAAMRLAVLACVGAALLLAAPPASAQVAAAPGLAIFGAPGAAVTFTLTVSAGTTMGSISLLTMGVPGRDFTAVPAGTTCPELVAGSCRIEVRFEPTTAGRRHGAIVVNDPSGHALLTVSLVGTGNGALLAFGPGVTSTFTGGGAGGDGGPASGARLLEPTGIAVDGLGNHYIADRAGNVVRRVTPEGIISTFAGTGVAGYAGDGGPAASAQLRGPMSVLTDGAGFVYIADTGNNVVRLVDANGVISTYAGQYYAPGSAPPPVCAAATNEVGDGCPGDQIVLNTPIDLVFCVAQNLHISDKLNHRVRTILRTSYRTITQVGNGTAGFSGDGGLNTSAQLDGPTGMAMDAANFIYVADSGNHVIRKTLLTGTIPNPIETIAGTPGGAGNLGDGGPAVAARLTSPHAVQVDPAGNVYVSDPASRVVRKVDQVTGLISTVAGVSAPLGSPTGLLVDEVGDLWIADAQGATVQKVDHSSAPSLTFPATPVGTTSAPQQVTLLNLGNSPLALGGISATSSYSLGGPGTSCDLSGGQTLAPASSCGLGVLFTPTAEGSVGGSVVVAGASGTAPSTMALSGTATSGTAATPDRPASGGGCGGGAGGAWSLALLGVALLATRRAGRGGAAQRTPLQERP